MQEIQQNTKSNNTTTMLSPASATLTTSAEDAIRAPPPSIEWLQTLELGYDLEAASTASAETTASYCFGCGVASVSVSTLNNAEVVASEKLSKCAKCHVASYCSKACQVQDWKTGGHRAACPAYARVGPQMTLSKPTDQQDARVEIFGRIRFYACPYAVHKAAALGRGFLFVQSDSTLASLSLPIAKDCWGRPMSMRWVLIHYLTIGEYDTEVCREDFELALVRKTLVTAVETYDDQQEVVLLMRFRCGHLAVGKAVLVPDFRLCQKLGRDYYANSPGGALQLNLDDL
jgi:hypothetical protein